jgi:hypothetical protein
MTNKAKLHARGRRRKSGAIKTVDDLRRHGEARILNEKIEQSNNRQKLMAKMDPKTAAFARREFARLGLF